MTSKTESTLPVIVVGAGPTGLSLACELKLAGTDVLVLEKRPHGTTGESRAPGINARTMEIFKMRGLYHRFVEKGRLMPFVVFSGLPIDPTEVEADWPEGLILPQHENEKLLLDHATELGVSVEWSSEVIHLKQEAAAVELVVKEGGAFKTYKSRYVVGCDGGQSNVRKAVGAVFDGTDPTSHWLVGDVYLDSPPGEKGAFGRNTRIGTYQVAQTEPGIFRITIMKRTPPKDRGAKVTLEELRETLFEGLGTDFGLRSARWLSRFNDGFRQVNEYRYGRVILLGDAAHTHAPIGGQGLNLGIQDATNLGWKLSLVEKGLAQESLLNTFQEERHPVGAAALKLAKAQTALIKPGEQIDELRAVFASTFKSPEVVREIAGSASGLAVRYAWAQGQHAMVGQRIPNLKLNVGGKQTELFEFLNAGKPILVSFGADGTTMPDAYLPRVRHIVATPTAEQNESKWKLSVVGEVPAVTSIFVRPDGIVGWVKSTVTADNTSDLGSALKTWLG